MMNATDKEYVDRLIMAAGAKHGSSFTAESIDTLRTIFAAILDEAGVDLYDFRRLGSGDYTLCDGWCQGS